MDSQTNISKRKILDSIMHTRDLVLVVARGNPLNQSSAKTEQLALLSVAHEGECSHIISTSYRYRAGPLRIYGTTMNDAPNFNIQRGSCRNFASIFRRPTIVTAQKSSRVLAFWLLGPIEFWDPKRVCCFFIGTIAQKVLGTFKVQSRGNLSSCRGRLGQNPF